MNGNGKYWQNLEELTATADEETAAREFPDELPVTPTQLDRRQLLAGSGLAVAAAGCSRAPVRHALPFVDKPEEMTPGSALHYATTCGGCTAGCGLLVKTRDGRPIKLEGNREAPLNRGGTCAAGQASLLSLYDDDRLRQPSWLGEAVTWEEIDERIVRRLTAIRAAGHAIVLVTGTLLSPTTRALVQRFCDHYSARHISYDPISQAALRRAHAETYGTPLLPHYRFERASAIVGLEADFLGTWLSPVEFARDYARRRRPTRGPGEDGEQGSEMSWHAQFESLLSLTGANADLRIPVDASEVGAIAAALFAALSARAGSALAVSPPLPDTVEPEQFDQVVDRLWRHRGEALVVCGLNDVASQVVVAAINDLLGGVGSTVDLAQPSLQKQGDEGQLVELMGDLRAGRVHGLILTGVNPLYDTPLGAELLESLANVPLSVALATHPSETTERVTAVCPDHHPLESWSDAEPVKGWLGLTQPTVSPLFATRSAAESLLQWTGSEETYHRHLERRWRNSVLEPTDEGSGDPWMSALERGSFAATADAEEQPGPFRADLEAALRTVEERHQRTIEDEGLELRLYETVALRDGASANNAWLQELPDPISRVSWGNYLAIAPERAAELDLETGDVVRLQHGSISFELPVFLQPGTAPRTLGLALGYGRRRAGRIGEGVGVDAYPLVGMSEEGLFRYWLSGVELSPTGRRERLAIAQREGSLHGRPIVKETTLAAYRSDPHAGNHDRPAELTSLWPERPERGHAWGLVIDLNSCLGCGACVVACQAENNVPVVGPEEMERGRGMHWLRIDRYYRGASRQPDTVFQPMLCQHCDNAPCETVCPVLATVQSSDGLNQQIYNRCVGTRYCANNCPYKVRRFNWFNYAGNDRFDYHLNSELGALVLNPDVVVRTRGVMEKCSLCVQRIQAGKLEARLAGRPLGDGDIQTACQQACPAEAILFGDLHDADSRLARRWRDERFYHVLEELNVRPSVGYLTKVRNREEA